jgi:hypothetical protein
MKKRRGRPPKDRLPPLEELPSWAVKRIGELSKKSGVTPSRIRDHALKLGLYSVQDQYASLIESLASADKLFSSNEEPVERDSPERTETAVIEPDELGFDREVTEMSEPVLEGTDQNGSADAALERGFEPSGVEAD